MAKCERCGKAGASEVKEKRYRYGDAYDEDGVDIAVVVGNYTTVTMLCADCKEKKTAEDKKVRWMLFILLFVLLMLFLIYG